MHRASGDHAPVRSLVLAQVYARDLAGDTGRASHSFCMDVPAHAQTSRLGVVASGAGEHYVPGQAI